MTETLVPTSHKVLAIKILYLLWERPVDCEPLWKHYQNLRKRKLWRNWVKVLKVPEKKGRKGDRSNLFIFYTADIYSFLDMYALHQGGAHKGKVDNWKLGDTYRRIKAAWPEPTAPTPKPAAAEQPGGGDQPGAGAAQQAGAEGGAGGGNARSDEDTDEEMYGF